MINPLTAATKLLTQATDFVKAGKDLAQEVCPKTDIL
jgi:hypothetical protein